MKPTADSRWKVLLEEKGLGLIDAMPNRLAFRRNIITEFFEKESDEVKEEVEKFRQTNHADEDLSGSEEEREEGEDVDQEIEEQKAKAQAYLR